MIGPTDLFHPSPAPHFKTLQVFMILNENALCHSSGEQRMNLRDVYCAVTMDPKLNLYFLFH
jgi:hypothetical protein